MSRHTLREQAVPVWTKGSTLFHTVETPVACVEKWDTEEEEQKRETERERRPRIKRSEKKRGSQRKRVGEEKEKIVEEESFAHRTLQLKEGRRTREPFSQTPFHHLFLTLL